jgi:subtilisin family serine protease
MKFILGLVFFLFYIIGCGYANGGLADKNPFDITSFNPYTDDGFNYEWHLKVIDPSLANSNSHINIFDAWKKTRGAGVKVAIIDYDFYNINDDLVSNVYATYDTQTNTTNVIKNLNSHGTSCASIIASPKNGKGVIGVAPEAKLILIDANLTIDDQKIRAFQKAKELGADIISCSWGFINQISSKLRATIKDMYDSNIVVIFSSGNNNGLDLDLGNYEVEAELPWVIGVGATDEDNKKAPYSNYGDNIDILAPGGKVNGGIYTLNYYNGVYGYFNGTSASAPIVAGVVALMLSVNHNLTPDQVREILITTADKIEPEVANYDPHTGFSHTHAYGKVNASAAVAKALTY